MEGVGELEWEGQMARGKIQGQGKIQGGTAKMMSYLRGCREIYYSRGFLKHGHNRKVITKQRGRQIPRPQNETSISGIVLHQTGFTAQADSKTYC